MKPKNTAQKTYLEREALTATPQKLQLMLIEAAIKNIHRTKMHWENNAFDSAFITITRVQDIITEILCCLDQEGAPEIAKSLAAIYIFVFRKIVAVKGPDHADSLDDALKVLVAERESWREICEKFGATNSETEKTSATFTSTTNGKNIGGNSLMEIKKPTAPHVSPSKNKTQTEKSSTSNQKFSWDV